MDTSNKQMIRIAQAIREQLHSLQDHRFREVQRLVYVVCTNLDQLQTGRRNLDQCANRGWRGAATRLTSQLENKLRDVPYAAKQALQVALSARNQLSS